MLITKATLPPVVRRELVAHEPADPQVPGFIVGLDPLVAGEPKLDQAITSLQPRRDSGLSPVLLVKPDETSTIFSYYSELDLVRTIAGEALKQVHPHLKTGVDALWFVYRAAKLHDDWSKPGSDKVLCAFQLFGLGMSGLKLASVAYPQLAVPDHWANGVNFLAKSGESIYLGKTPPINELVLSTDKRMAIPLKLMKVAGIALDPAPQFDPLKASPLITGAASAPGKSG